MVGVCLNRTTIIPSAISSLNFEITLSMTEIRGNPKNFKLGRLIPNASIYIAAGSDLNAAYLSNCALALSANKSISGLKHKCSYARFKNFDWSIHSVSTGFGGDFLSVTVFSCSRMRAAGRGFFFA